MQLTVVQATAQEHPTPLLVLPLFEKEEPIDVVRRVDGAIGGQISRLIESGDFKAREGQTQLLYPSGGIAAERILLVGLGDRGKLDLERIRRAAATVVRQARRVGVDRLSALICVPELLGEAIPAVEAGRAFGEGAELGAFVFDELKSGEKEETDPRKPGEVELFDPGVAGLREGVELGVTLGRAENLARRLGNLPGNIATPMYLAEQAREIAGRHGMEVQVLGRNELEREGLNALLAVSRGSDEEPVLIVLRHRRGSGDGQPLVLVGKGLTFDSGGISIKPAQGMEEMKFDMCGGAAVLGAMEAIGEIGVDADVIGIIPSSENLISGAAMKPGDIIRSHLGKTIEVVNTDAEGRLILADALSYARRFEPAAIVDAATLTGACVIALGNHATAALGNDEALLDEIRRAGDRVHERVWPLPMHEEYRDQIKSDYADIKNSGGRAAGTITAAWFLREFVGEIPWVHLDVAGTAYGDGKLAYQSKGATGVPTRLFVEWVLSRVG